MSINLALDFLHLWEQVRVMQVAIANVATSVAASDLTWKKPSAGTFKCNVEAAVYSEKNKYGVGLCIRDAGEVFRGGKTMWFYGSLSLQEAEVMSLVQVP